MNTNEKNKIKQLWHYLQLNCDETLIIENFNHEAGENEFIVVKTGNDDELDISVLSELPELTPKDQFQFIKQLSSGGKFTILSVEQIENDKLADY